MFRPSTLSPLLVALLAACSGPKDDKPDMPVDADGDGFLSDQDCNDDDELVFPGAVETCNEADDDCDETVDEEVADAPTWYGDDDGDGFGRDNAAVEVCTAPAGFVAQGGDCDDTNAAFHPDASELCTEPADYNCDGSVGYADADADLTPACEDCDDSDPTVHPGADELCNEVDDDCDGSIDVGATDAPTWYADVDADGYGDELVTSLSCTQPLNTVAAAGDCDDADAAYHPGAEEVCTDPTDYNCDGSSLFEDADADLSPACLDCDDGSATRYPGAPETCNDTDDDCDTVPDNDPTDASVWYADTDADGFGALSVSLLACDQPVGYVLNDTDCNDSDATILPGGQELCDAGNADEDCDGTTDDGDPSVLATTKATWYIDGDSDTYGAPAPTLSRCDLPVGYAATNDDCDDTVAAIHPGASELCDAGNVDENCDTLVNDSTAIDAARWYADSDADSYGNPNASLSACALPVGYVADNTDCNDNDLTAYPGADEVCDSVDDDCDGTIDDNPLNPLTWYIDADADGYGHLGTPLAACVAPPGYAGPSTDCDDTRADVSPGDPERCDVANTDEDCDGTADDADASVTGQAVFYADADGDGFGSAASSSALLCDAPVGYVTTNTDCDDASASTYPGATEVVGNGSDDDCDGGEFCINDADNDGYTAPAHDTRVSADTDCADAFEALSTDPNTDCNDANAAAYPGHPEICADNIDNDCIVNTDCVFDGTLAATSADVRLNGGTASDYLGRGVAVGDFDGDGQEDLLGGAYGSDNPGSSAGLAMVWYGPVDTSGSAATADLIITGSATLQYTGWDVATADLNGDGMDEMLIGAYYTSTQTGALHIVYGGTTAMGTTTTAALTATDGVTFTGAASGDYFSYSVAEGGDLDGDGYEELVVGAKYQDGITGSLSSAGAVYLVYGSSARMTGTRSATTANAILYGAVGADYLGEEISIVPDVNGDGLDEMLLGAYYADRVGTSEGAAYLVLGDGVRLAGGALVTAAADLTLYGVADSDYAGADVAELGDLDGDGYGDYGVHGFGFDGGGLSYSGALWVYGGGATPTNTKVATLHGSAASDYFGGDANSPGDLDDDGNDDLIAAAYYYDVPLSSSGGAFLFYGPVAGTIYTAAADATFTGSPTGTGYFGQTMVAGQHDVTGDGADNLLIGAYADTSSMGAIYIWSDIEAL